MNTNGKPPVGTFGEPINVYTRRQAIEDGVLVDLMQPETAGLVREAGFKFPVAMTAGAFAATVAEIGNISNVVSENSSIVNTIATAVEEQAVTANEISQNIAQISQGIQVINENVAQSSTVSAEIAREIADVDTAATEMSENSNRVSSNATRLNDLSNGFSKLVATFKV